MELYDVYEKNKEQIGEKKTNKFKQEVILLPISHTTQTAHIEVNITEDGEFHTATVLGKNDNRNTVIPCTLESASRSSNLAPYPLHDKLCYVAGDYVKYGGTVKTKDFVEYGGKKKKGDPHFAYLNNLKLWVSSSHANEKVKIIYEYLSKGCLIRDLISQGVLHEDNGLLIEKWDKNYEEKYGSKPDIFSAVTGKQTDAFVRFNIYSPTKILKEVWYDQEVANSFINFYNSSLQNFESGICYVTGKLAPITELHANKIRNAADKSKLISSNDESGFTYRGRFETAKQAATISYEASQKAHNALKWLIGLQGDTINQRVFLIWGINEIPLLLEDDPLKLSPNPKEFVPVTEKEYALRVNKAVNGYRTKYDTKESVNILILDAATTGRLAVTYYQRFHKELYLDRLEYWYQTCSWRFREKHNETGKSVEFVKTPTPKEIATATYGLRDDKLIKETVERILICMFENIDQQIPKDIERSLIIRASRPTTMENWEWEKCLSVACAIIRKNRKKREEINMSLETENKNRSYLFGRLLAVADVAERTALNLNGETRDTNAMRYMTAFSNQPEKTWKVIREQLHPYLMKLGKGGFRFTQLMDEITDEIGTINFNNERLDGLYLVGLSSQRRALYQKKQELEENEAE